jgi:hypothetical protein
MNDETIRGAIKNAGVFHAVALATHKPRDKYGYVRSYIANVVVEPLGDNRALLVATDGQMLLAAPVWCEMNTTEPFVIYPTKELMRETKPKRKAQAYNPDWLVIKQTVAAVWDHKQNSTISLPLHDNGSNAEDFPEWRRLFRDRDYSNPVPFTGPVDPSALEKVVSIGKVLISAGHVDKESVSLVSEAKGDGPIKLVYGKHDAVGLVMPLTGGFVDQPLTDLDWLGLNQPRESSEAA